MSLAHLPEAIVAAVTALATDLSAWGPAHPDPTLAEQETAVLGAVRTHLPALLHAVLLTTQRTAAHRPVRCPTCHRAAGVHDYRRRQLLTLCGPVDWERPWATCSRCEGSFGAGDAALGVRAYAQRSTGLEALLVLLGTVTSFREAATLLRATTGLRVASETVRQVTAAAGRACADAQDAATAAYATGAEPVVAAAAVVPHTLVVETDGVMVRYLSGWHEVKVGVVGGWDTTAGRRLAAVSYVAAREESSAFAVRWGAEAARRGALTVLGWHGPHQGVAELRPVVVLGDGAKWIWEAAATQFGERTEIVDYFHACEHLSTVAGVLHGVGTAAAATWAAARREELRMQGVTAILPQLTAPLDLAPAAVAPLRRERGYFRSNAARMDYPAFRRAGLPIGSGAVESSAKHVVQQRLKRPGARWSDAGARAMLALRAQHASYGTAA